MVETNSCMKLIVSIDQLLKAPSYRGFLHVLYTLNKSENPQFSYAYIAKQCGFSSKSFIKEVIDSKKSLTRASCEKVIKGLKLPKSLGDYFFYITAKDEGFTDLKEKQLEKEIYRVKSKLLKKDITEAVSTDIFKTLSWPYVYAALGEIDVGATLKEIEQRTQLPADEIKKTLNVLLEKKLIEQRESRFLANDPTAFFGEIGSSSHFKAFFLHALTLQYERAKKNFNSKDELYFSMSFSAQTQQMTQFKKDLQDLLDKYSSTIEDPNGDRIVTLTCGMHYTK